MISGRKAHIAEEMAREEGNFLEALRLSDEATLLYQKEEDAIGLSEIQAARFEIFKHLFEETDDKNYLILAKMAAKTGVKIARNSGKPESLAIPLFCYGKALHLKGKHDKAIETFKEALDVLPKSHQNRPSVESDIKVHLAVCEYISGDETALQRAEEALNTLEQTGEQKYEKDVWVSGGYMKIAEAIYAKESNKGEEYLSKAKDIINSNSDLILRKKQLERLFRKLHI